MKKKKINRDGNDDDDVSSNPIISVPDNIVFEILSRLPVKSLMRFKCVCQNWRTLIQNDPYLHDLHLTGSTSRPGLLFVVEHLDYEVCFMLANLFQGRAVVHTITNESLDGLMLNPINGLLCFRDMESASVRIYNLSTREMTPWFKTTIKKELEQKKGENGVEIIYHPTFVFGFDTATKEHKVLCVSEIHRANPLPLGGELISQAKACKVLTVGRNSWRRIDEVPPYKLAGSSICVNGTIYWRNVSHDRGDPPEERDVIVAFDFESEKFRVVRIPNFILNQSRSLDVFGQLFSLLEVDGCLALLHRMSVDTVKLWIFDDSDKKEQSTTTTTNTSSTSSTNWIEETISLPFGLDGNRYLRFQAIAGTGEIIITPSTFTNFVVYSYDRKKKMFMEVDISGIPSILSDGFYSLVTPFAESLFPVQQHQYQTQPPLGN